MRELFEPLLKILKTEKVQTDNLIFRLHYKFAFAIFVLFSMMNTAKQYFGSPIECLAQGIPPDVMNTYCFYHGTYTVTDLQHITVRIQILFNLVIMTI